MRNLLYVLGLVLPVFVFGAWGIGSASEDATFEFILPSIVAVTLDNSSIQWDFTDITVNPNNPEFPPASFPEYYEPTTPNGRPYQVVNYLVLFAGGGVNWQLTVRGDGDPTPSCGIELSEIEYADNPPVNWVSFSTSPSVIESGSGSTLGWQHLEQNYRVEIDGDETNTASSSCVITYTIQTL